ncbi:DUF222 domain-containing protein, partial [Georgenia ruanii]|nr:DUF222 domain-containing protein [Georgenia ruanii]
VATMSGSAPSAAVAATLDQVGALLTDLNAVDLQALPSQALLDTVGRIETLQRQLEGLNAKALAAAEADGLWATTGARSFAAWYRNVSGRHTSTARRQVRQARVLRDRLPAAAKALAQGEIGPDHVAALVRHTTNSPLRRDQLGDEEMGEEFLVARARELDAADFLHIVKHWAVRTDPDAADRAWKDDGDRAELTIAETTGGYHLAGWLSKIDGMALVTALDARVGVPAADDTRTVAQRRAAALGSLARLALDGGTLKPGARIRPHLAVHVPIDTLLRMVTASRPDDCDGAPSRPGTAFGAGPLEPQPLDVIPAELDPEALAGAEPATLEDGTPIPHAELARLACQSQLHRVIFGPDSEVLDLGREERLYTAAQARAIIARDRRCQYPGCNAPPYEGEIHHSLYWYAHDGPTDVGKGVLLCWYHHDYVHLHRIAIHRFLDRWRFVRPDGSVIGETGVAA